MDLIVLSVVLLIVALAAGYVVREKKKGVKCVGCPYAAICAKGCCTGCDQSENERKKHPNV